ncbi:MAG TPA: ABC transporter substrate-binding protein [Thermodesulfobacteriota bacterium]|nr:ABC transporter substrate-binding protein [Thermodesulfobacteriota bacterium]
MTTLKGKAFLFSLLVLIFVAWASPAYVAEKSYKIGVNLEFTGPWAEVTKTVRNAMVLEVERINKMGGIDGRPLELLFEDNGFDLSRAAANMTKFTKDKEVIAVVGPFEDNLQATTRAIAEREKITNMIICPSNPMVRALKQTWAFNIAQSDIIVSQKLVDLSLARKYKKVLVFHAAHPLAQSLADYYKKFGEEKGMKVIISKETHKPTDIDMTPQLIKLKPIIEQEKVDAFYACTAGPPGPIICKNLRTLGVKIPILGTHAFGFGFIIALGGEAMEGVEFGAAKPVVFDQLDENDPVRSVNIDFDKQMKDHYGVGLDQLAGYGHDTVSLISDALKRCQGKVTRATFRDALENTKGLKNCHGIYNYSPTDHDGLIKKDMVFVRIEGGKFKRIKFPGLE